MKIKISEIVVEDRKRQADDKKVKELAISIKEIGLLHPIVLTPDNRLVGGLHRIKAVQSLGWDEIDYTVKDYDQLHAELAEIDENIQRSDPSYLERGNMMLRRKEIFEILHPESKVGGDKKSEDFRAKKAAGQVPKSFAADTAGKIGLTERSVRQEMQIAKTLTPAVQETAREIGLQKSDALRLTKTRDPKFQKLIIDRIAQRKAKNVREAEQQLQMEKEIEHGRNVETDDSARFEEGDPIELLRAVPDESIKAIISNIPMSVDFSILAHEAGRILQSGGILAIMIHPSDLELVFKTEMPPELQYHWILADTLQKIDQPNENVQSSWMPIIIFAKDGRAVKLSNDLITKAIDSLRHDEDHSIQIIGKVSSIGDTVLDPFLNRKLESYLAPAIGRKFIGFSHDKGLINQAKSHLEKVKDVIAAA
jgi:hypothetical protein